LIIRKPRFRAWAVAPPYIFPLANDAISSTTSAESPGLWNGHEQKALTAQAYLNIRMLLAMHKSRYFPAPPRSTQHAATLRTILDIDPTEPFCSALKKYLA